MRDEPLNDHVERFELNVAEEILVDLRARLVRTRWPDAETVDDWSQGIPLAYVRDVCSYWSGEYDWRRIEQTLNRLGQFRTPIDGLGIHFLLVRSPEPDAFPLVLTHGWPGSVTEFLKVIGPLSDPVAFGGERTDAFHVVCPSLPGYGFSDKPTKPGWTMGRIARCMGPAHGPLGVRSVRCPWWRLGCWCDGMLATSRSLALRWHSSHHDHLCGSRARRNPHQ